MHTLIIKIADRISMLTKSLCMNQCMWGIALEEILMFYTLTWTSLSPYYYINYKALFSNWEQCSIELRN